MRSLGWATACALAGLLAATAPLQAQEPDKEKQKEKDTAGTPPAPRPEVEGAIGLVLRNAGEYQGAAARTTKVSPAFFLRWGRFTITTGGGLATRRNDEVVRGVAAELVRREDLDVRLSLRFDNGRQASDSAALAGQGDIRSTVRVRLGANWRIGGGWQASASANTDLLGRDGGTAADVGLGYERRLNADSVWNSGVNLGLAGSRYLRTWYGVSAEQALRSGYPVYEPHSGLRDFSIGTGLKSELSDNWVGFANLGFTRLLGPAADSPLTKKRNSLGGSVALAWRF